MAQNVLRIRYVHNNRLQRWKRKQRCFVCQLSDEYFALSYRQFLFVCLSKSDFWYLFYSIKTNILYAVNAVALKYERGYTQG